jgi:hypothetical protein
VPAIAEGSEQGWARTVMTVLRQAAASAISDAGDDRLDPHLLVDLQEGFDKATAWSILTHRLRTGTKASTHPGYRLAKRPTGKAEHVPVK